MGIPAADPGLRDWLRSLDDSTDALGPIQWRIGIWLRRGRRSHLAQLG
ncbi:MAG: hypothetical protein LBT54_04375 [Bifidobacteriaceae bacterium]|nr:hypothetical protein [Bifidobacteriaceae bacterium]